MHICLINYNAKRKFAFKRSILEEKLFKEMDSSSKKKKKINDNPYECKFNSLTIPLNR